MAEQSNYARVWSRLGLLAMCAPLLSLLQGGLGLDVVPSLADVLTFYRGLTDAVLDIVYFPVRWLFGDDPGRLVRDLHAISFLGMALYLHSLRVIADFRARGGSFRDDAPDEEERRPLRWDQKLVMTYVGGILFLGLPWLTLTVLFVMPIHAMSVVVSRWRGMKGQLPFPENESIARADILARQGWVLIAALFAYFVVSWIGRAA